jgi:hypothetical protein
VIAVRVASAAPSAVTLLTVMPLPVVASRPTRSKRSVVSPSRVKQHVDVGRAGDVDRCWSCSSSVKA